MADHHLNVVPLSDGAGSADIRIRAHYVQSEPKELRDKYIMFLEEKDRRPDGSPTVVPAFKEFTDNFSIFSEASLSELDWSNVVVAASAVLTSLLPVPTEYRGSKRSLRQFYHQEFAPASDVDLFMYGLSEEQAIEKINLKVPTIPGLPGFEVSYCASRSISWPRNLFLEREPESFVSGDEEGSKNAWRAVYGLCLRKAAEGAGKKRKLVSLFEANEVAKRFATRKGRNGEGEHDVISRWY